jgi:two-component system, NarL family, nitrate/nitrite response regulator NarL
MKKHLGQISLVIADDHPFLLEGIARVLDAEPGLSIVAKCGDGVEGLDAIRQLKPDIAVLDIAMPRLNGLEVLQAVNNEQLATRVIFLTANATDQNIFTLIENGASGLLLKDAAVAELVTCIKQVSAGSKYLPKELISAAIERETGKRTELRHIEELSGREREILFLLGEGLANKEIAYRLGLAEGTVRIHVHNIYQKTGIPSRMALIAAALAYLERRPKG